MQIRTPLVAVILLLAMTGAAAAQMKCTVNDPTGTPLNVRSKPNGRIVGTLKNGTPVNAWAIHSVQGKLWARITPPGAEKSRWVFRQYLSCQELYD